MSQVQATAAVSEVALTQWTPVQRVVFPDGEDMSLWPLYVDWGTAPSSAALSAMTEDDVNPAFLMSRGPHRPPREFTRRSIRVEEGDRLSLATYFNGFPAAYWQHWTDVRRVRFDIELKGRASVAMLRSSARGTFTTVAVRSGEGVLSFELPLDRFGDGGWLWPEIEATEGATTVVRASWSVPGTKRARTTRATIAMTTFNMPDECLKQARRFLSEPEVFGRLAEVLIMDQGTRHVVDEPDYEEVNAALGGKLRVIEQPNLGGSGGYSRGMSEMLAKPGSDYVILLDDDAEIETEGALRAINFADHCLRPTIVGGQMLNLHERTILHSMGETVDSYRFWWDSVSGDVAEIDLAQRTIRTDPALNRRVDVRYNGWWMCLIPKTVASEIGLSLPFFIKWDDAEYGLRAAEQGFPTVSMPGVAVWHVPWTEKDDGLDWQAYFHQRNRWVSALLHSPYPRGGGFPKSSFAVDVKHLLSLQYYPESLRLQALEDVLKGPDHLFPTLLTRADEARSRARDFDDGQLISDAANFPEARRANPVKGGKAPSKPRNMVSFGVKAVTGALRQLHAPDDLARTHPQEVVANTDARWWRLSNLDSALVSNAAGSGAWFYKRDNVRFRVDLRRCLHLYSELVTHWDRLAEEYRAALTDVTSPEAWSSVFER